jgi:antitoxin component of RelBE/YafQ-DinJ toxin-antitoxin module
MEQVLLQVRMDSELRKALRVYCAEHGITVSQCIREMVKKFLEEKENESVGTEVSGDSEKRN